MQGSFQIRQQLSVSRFHVRLKAAAPGGCRSRGRLGLAASLLSAELSCTAPQQPSKKRQEAILCKRARCHESALTAALVLKDRKGDNLAVGVLWLQASQMHRSHLECNLSGFGHSLRPLHPQCLHRQYPSCIAPSYATCQSFSQALAGLTCCIRKQSTADASSVACSAGDARELVTASLDKSLALWRLQVSSFKADGQRHISLCWPVLADVSI